jgi:hypothetical protein
MSFSAWKAHLSSLLVKLELLSTQNIRKYELEDETVCWLVSNNMLSGDVQTLSGLVSSILGESG